MSNGLKLKNLPDVIPEKYIIPARLLPWEPVPVNTIQERARQFQPVVSGAALGLWLKFAEPERTAGILEGDGITRFEAQLDYLNHAILSTTNGDVQHECGAHIPRTIGRAMLHGDRHQPWSLPLSLWHEEQMVPRNANIRTPRVEEFTLIAHDLSANLPRYVLMAQAETAA